MSTPTNRIYAYIRVSRKEQNLDRQLIALAPFNIPKRRIFADKQSGKDFNRHEYQKLINKIQTGDLMIIKAIDRLGRNYAEIIDQWRFITRDIGADIKVLDMPLLDTTYCKDLLGTFISDLVLQILSFMAQMERENLLQRQAEGIAAARAKGVVFGRESLPLPEDFEDICQQWQEGSISRATAARRCGFSERTLYRRAEEWKSV